MSQKSSYDGRYAGQEYYWGTKPSAICHQVLQLLPPDQPVSLLDIGCGEGRNAVFFAHNGYGVTAFDSSAAGVAKTELLAEAANVPIAVFQADMNGHRLEGKFDVLFSTGVFHLIPRKLRQEVFAHYKQHTAGGGLNVFSVFVRKPFIGKAPDGGPGRGALAIGGAPNALPRLEDRVSARKRIFDCMSGGIPHQHAVNRVIARNI